MEKSEEKSSPTCSGERCEPVASVRGMPCMRCLDSLLSKQPQVTKPKPMFMEASEGMNLQGFQTARFSLIRERQDISKISLEPVYFLFPLLPSSIPYSL